MANEYRLSYTAQEINTRLSKIDNLANKSELPTKTSDLTNDNGFITESYVLEYAQPTGDYALKSEIPKVSVQSINGQTGAVNLSASDIGALPDTTEIPTVPTNVSAFDNDAGYLTNIPDEYITETELAAKGYLTEHQSLEGYATETYVNTQIQSYVDEAILGGAW